MIQPENPRGLWKLTEMTLICSGISLPLHSWIGGWWILSCRAVPGIVNHLEALALTLTLCNHVPFLEVSVACHHGLIAFVLWWQWQQCGSSVVVVFNVPRDGTAGFSHTDKYTTAVPCLRSLFALMDKKVWRHWHMFYGRKHYLLVLRDKRIQIPKNYICSSSLRELCLRIWPALLQKAVAYGA